VSRFQDQEEVWISLGVFSVLPEEVSTRDVSGVLGVGEFV